MTAVAVVSLEELRTIVREAVRAELGTQPVNDVLTRDECAALLQVHPRVVVTYVRTRGLPGKQVGRSWRFRREEVLRWLEEQAVRPGARTESYAKKIARLK